MRVAVIGHTYVVDANRGKWRALAPRCEALRLFAPSVWPERDFWTRECEPAGDLDVVALPARDAGHARRWRFSFVKLRGELLAFRPDVLHVEAEAGSAIALEAAWLCRSALFTQFVWENIPIDSPWRRALAKWNYARIDHLFGGSNGALSAARADGYCGAATVVPQVGVDVASVDRTNATRVFNDDRFVVGFVGRMDAKKGVHVLLDAIRILDGQRIGLVFVGDGPERGILRERASRDELSGQVRFVDPVPHDTVASYIKGFDLLVLPSVSTPGWREQFGHVLIEAMACGVPVIGSRCGAIPEVIGDAGVVVDENDATALAREIARLIGDADGRNKYVLAGRRRVESLYTDEAVADALRCVWTSLAKESKRDR